MNFPWNSMSLKMSKSGFKPFNVSMGFNLNLKIEYFLILWSSIHSTRFSLIWLFSLKKSLFFFKKTFHMRVFKGVIFLKSIFKKCPFYNSHKIIWLADNLGKKSPSLFPKWQKPLNKENLSPLTKPSNKRLVVFSLALKIFMMKSKTFTKSWTFRWLSFLNS